MEAVQLKYSKYPVYKDSGADWLGKIPEEWNLVANKYIFKLNKVQVGKKSNDYDLLSLTLNGIIKRVLEDGGKFPAEFDTYQEVKKGDFVFCLFDVEETPRTVGLSKFDGMITGAYTVMQVNNSFDRSFLYYFYLNLDSKKRLKPLYRGLRNTIPKDSFFSFKTFVPPLSEQSAIANFLDNKTAKIDTAIAQKEKMIELLKERKQIIIQNAVTKGLNPNAKMKDSGVEWIGEIPEGWEVKRLKFVLELINDKESSKDSDELYIGMENIESQTGKYIQTQSEVEGLANKFIANDILFGKLRPYLAKVYLTKFSGLCSTEFLVYRTNNPSYFQKLLLSRAFISMVDSSTYGAKMPRVSADWVNNRYIPVPKLDEQKEIISHIATQSTKIDKAIALQQTQIDKLKEYKAVLIDSAVTGKIKVC
jgi:type I restriction enzyme S subunit